MMKKMLAAMLAGIIAITPAAAYAGVVPRQQQEETASGESAAESAEAEAGEAAQESSREEAAEESPEKVISDVGDGVWVTDIRLGIKKEKQLRDEQGMTLAKWDEALAERKEQGLAAPLTKVALFAADPDAEILEDADGVYFIGRNEAFPSVSCAEDAYELAWRLIGLLGGSKATDLQLWSELQANGTTVYSFQEIRGNAEYLGSTIKIAAGEDGTVTGVFSSLGFEGSSEEYEVNADVPHVTQAEAEAAVAEKLAADGVKAEVHTDLTDRIAFVDLTLAEALNLDDPQEETEPLLMFWVVYTDNPDTEEAAAYPLIANYVSLDGTYHHSLPVAFAGDADSLCGYRRQNVFDGMTADTWTGEITDIDGNKITVTLPVMYSEADGKWYLGDVDRKIAVADFAEAVYGENHEIKLIGSDTNDGWDNEDLFMLHNYISAYEFYKDMGWNGPDGRGTEVVILKGLCTSNGTPYENACSIGLLEGLQFFGYAPYNAEGNPLSLVKGLDVMAHEFTHTFTGTVMNTNLYKNDLGAINEAMSDIMGNLVEQILDATDDTTWLLGENTGHTVRSMSDPHVKQQPEYVWDLFYGPKVEKLSDVNDNGGVHFNSSLLNRIAALLCLEHEMSHEDAVSFWTMTAMGMTPATDYPKMEALLTWALEESGLEDYQETVSALVEEEKLSLTEIPEELPEGQEMVTLELPEGGAFENPEDWAMVGFQIDTDLLTKLAGTAWELIEQLQEDPEASDEFEEFLTELLENLEMKENRLDLDLEGLLEDKKEDGIITGIADVLSDFSGLLTQYTSWPSVDGNVIRMVQKPYPTMYLLISVKESGTKITGVAVLLGDHWYDIGRIVNLLQEDDKEGEKDEESEGLFSLVLALAKELIVNTVSDRIEAGISSIFFDEEEEAVETNEESSVVCLPADGLESVVPAAS